MTAVQPRHDARSLGRILAVLGLAVLGILFSTGRASALQVAHHTFASSFNGTGTTKGPFGTAVYSVGVDETTGDVYVLSIGENQHLVIDKFDDAGSPLAFTAPELGGSSSIFLADTNAPSDPTPNLVVDNSPGATQGRFYVTDGSHPAFYGFEASGKSLTGSPFALPQFPVGIAVSAITGEIWALFGNTQNTGPTFVKKYTTAGVDSGTEFSVDNETARFPNQFSIDSQDNLFIRGFGKSTPGVGADQGFFKFDQAGNVLEVINGGFPSAIGSDMKTGDLYLLRYSNGSQVGELSSDGTEIDSFKAPLLEYPSQLGVNGTTGTVYVSDRSNEGNVLIFTAGPKVTVAKPTTGTGSNFQATSVTLSGNLDPSGVSTTECRFEYGTEASITTYEHTINCDQGQVLSGSGDQPVTATITGLTQAARYHFRLVAANANGFTAGRDVTFVPSALPLLTGVGASEVHSDIASLHATVNPGGADTHYHFEYGPADCAVSACTSTADVDVGKTLEPQSALVALAGLTPGTVYHYRIVAVNQSGTSVSLDKTIQTFPPAEGGTDDCANAHVRQQTSAARLLDCRAYELVSASDTAGYDVVSNLVSSQEPYGGYPEASNPSRVLYAVQGGGIPGTNHPTNRGPDPYVASRGANGWSTEYVGVPADNPYSLEPFSSRPTGASSGLAAFAFGGPEGCSPCFAGQYTGIPVRLAGGALVQGMAGSLDPGPTAKAEGFIGRDLSADGSHLVFGSKAQFEADGNNNGDLSIYDRNLTTGQTHVVSKTTGGATMTGAGIAELDISADGSHVVIGQRVSTDAEGNDYYHPYMTVGDVDHSIDLAPGSTSGVLFDGMSADGATVYFTTVDRLSTDDTDNSADIYEDQIAAGASTVEPTLVSTGGSGPSNDDSCEPPGEWNVASGGMDCSALAIAGGGGVSRDGTAIYFFSPELLDGPSNGTVDQPNLYVARGGASPRFVATIDSSIGKPPPAPPIHPVENAALVTGLGAPESVAYDGTRNDIYVAETGPGRVSRFTAAGAPDNFTAGPGSGTNQIGSLAVPSSSNSQIAVDPSNGDLFVTNVPGEVKIFGPDGSALGALNGSGTPGGTFSEACGVAVDPSGDVFVGDYSGRVWRYHRTSTSAPLTDANYSVTGIETAGLTPCNLAVDGAGSVYASAYSNGPLKRFEASTFAAVPPSETGTTVNAKSTTVATDPQTGDVYVDEGNQVALFDSSGQLVTHFGSGAISTSRGVAVDPANGHVFAASDESKIVSFGVAPSIYKPIDNPAVVHGVSQAATRDQGDFQVTPDGAFSTFPTTQPIKSTYQNAGHTEIYRYGPAGGSPQVDCVSCDPTNVSPVGDAAMASAGLSLADDGRVFFSTPDPLVSRDSDEKRDVYEWEQGTVQLVSTGVSRFDSGLLSASANGTDVYFFTRDSLAPQDQNGPTMKVYDARAGGGFEFVPATVPCKASDECHGPGTVAAASPEINTVHGDAANVVAEPKPHHKKKHHKKKHRHHKKHHQKRQGGSGK